jgi:serine/threonine protein kinase
MTEVRDREWTHSPTIATMHMDDVDREGETSAHSITSEEERWDVTKNDLPIASAIGLRVMDHADVVLKTRLSNASPDVLDVVKFEKSVARFQNCEIELGRRLAFGNFADIYSIESFRPSKATKTCTSEQMDAAETLKKTRNAKSLVVKVLRAQLLLNPGLYATGAADVLTEGTLLAMLDHPHILALRGRSVSSVEGFASGKRDAFFLVFDKLEGTLGDLLKDWQQRAAHARPFMIRKRDQRSELLLERVRILTDIADALAYLHKRRIIHRDLKLSNIGMDSKGRAVLLDFGLAKVLPPNAEKETFRLTGNTGSVRYMAPEVARGDNYNLKADIFSFSIVIYEVLNMCKSWNGLQPQEIRDKVHLRKHRPAISMFFPASLRDLIKSMWSDLPAARLPIQHVHTILSKQLEELSSGT